MADHTDEHVTRRDFLKLGVTITAGAIVPPIVAACGGGDSSYTPPTETFVEPLDIRSVNGVLDVTLVLSYLTTTLPDATGKKQTVTLRNMYGTIPAPTLRMRVGDLLRIKVFNSLPANPAYPPVEPADMKCPTLWVVGSNNTNAFESAQAYRSKLAGTRVTLEVIEGMSHPQEFEQIDRVFAREIEFTRSHR